MVTSEFGRHKMDVVNIWTRFYKYKCGIGFLRKYGNENGTICI
jgi:hypothetical protein